METFEKFFAERFDIHGLVAEREDTSSDCGESTAFPIAQTEPGANISAAAVLVDGAEIDCGG